MRRHLRARCARALKRRLKAAGLPMMDNPSHIVPILVGDPVLTKRITDALLDRFAIYMQPINYPTAPRSTERLRITPQPQHSDADMDALASALSTLWREVKLPRRKSAIWSDLRKSLLRRCILLHLLTAKHGTALFLCAG
jgi:5-aminolevulinate synthase